NDSGVTIVDDGAKCRFNEDVPETCVSNIKASDCYCITCSESLDCGSNSCEYSG
ncbi:19413_t:CDS:2, partial [Racocetra fulgida]